MSKQSVYFRLQNADSKKDRKLLKQGLDTIPGVISVSVNDQTGKLAVDYDSTGTSSERIGEQLEKMGYRAQLLAREDHTM